MLMRMTGIVSSVLIHSRRRIRLTVGKEHPGREEESGDDGGDRASLESHDIVENVRPVLRSQDL